MIVEYVLIFTVAMMGFLILCGVCFLVRVCWDWFVEGLEEFRKRGWYRRHDDE